MNLRVMADKSENNERSSCWARRRWADPNIRIPFRQGILANVGIKDHQQVLSASGALGLTFASRTRGEVGSECQIRSTSRETGRGLRREKGVSDSFLRAAGGPPRPALRSGGSRSDPVL